MDRISNFNFMRNLLSGRVLFYNSSSQMFQSRILLAEKFVWNISDCKRRSHNALPEEISKITSGLKEEGEVSNQPSPSSFVQSQSVIISGCRVLSLQSME